MQRRADLEDAVLNIQQLVMQCHPRHGAASPQTNIVDLAVYINDVSEAAQQLSRSAEGAGARGGGGPHARAAAAVAAHSRALGAALQGPAIDVDHAAKECASRVQKINTAIECCAESPEKDVLKREARPLHESSTLLQFASQSSIATTQCAAIDEALNDLTDLEHRIDRMLQPREGETRVVQAPSPSLYTSRARLATAAAGVRRSAQELAPAFTRYVADMRASVDVADDNKRRRLAEHLKKLQDRLKLLTMETGRQVATWRPEHQGPVPAITENILKELDNAESVIQGKPGTAKSYIAHEDLKKLLLPVDIFNVEGDIKQLEAKLESTATKLNSMTETITLSARKPESLTRTAHLTAETALQLTAIAKSMASDEDVTKHNRIEEASQELCFVTYDLLKTAESTSHEPNSFESRRRLQDACRSLTDAINKLVRTASTADKLQRDCNELSRSLQLRHSCLQPRPTCALPYADCVAALQTQHGVIENLNSGQPMSRQEFSTSLDLLASAVGNNAEYAEQCAYLLSISEQHPALCKQGLFDAMRARRLAAAAAETCFRVMRRASSIRSEEQLLEASGNVDAAGVQLQAVLNTNIVSVDKLTPPAFAVIDALSSLRAAAEHPSLAPPPAPSAPAQQRADEVIQHTKYVQHFIFTL
ncbi:talin-2-like [Choristoneura fumiferana]|uniref:talin-2-like n=1 Tax=Choristoneura fumiferana TaxID=7141 RepID=UPI003D156B81